MGLLFARNLAESGVPVLVYNRTQSKAEAMASASVKWVATPKDLGRAVSRGVTFVMLSDGPATKSFLFGRSGYGRTAGPGALLVNLATVDPEESRAFAARLGERGIHYLDAPVAGSVDLAARKEVTFFVGGDEVDVARVRPLLERIGRRVDHLGPVGSGNAMKLVNNLLTIGNTALATEAIALAQELGLDLSRVLELLHSGGGQSTMLDRKAPAFRERRYAAQFTTALARKDLRLVERAAARGGGPLRMTREARKMLEASMAQGHGSEDFSSVLEVTLTRGRVPAAKSAESPGAAGPA